VTTLAGDQPSLPLAIGDFSRAFRPLLVPSRPPPPPPPAPAVRDAHLSVRGGYVERRIMLNAISDTRIRGSDTRILGASLIATTIFASDRPSFLVARVQSAIAPNLVAAG
jgi:hypothetical protein